MMPSRPLNMPVMFSSVFQPVSTQSGPISVQNFKKILDIITPKIPEYAQYFKDRLAEYTILFDLNQESPSPLLVEEMDNIINTVETQTVGQYPELAADFKITGGRTQGSVGQYAFARKMAGGMQTQTMQTGEGQLTPSKVQKETQIAELVAERLVGNLRRTVSLENPLTTTPTQNPLTSLTDSFFASYLTRQPSYETSGTSTPLPEPVPEKRRNRVPSGQEYELMDMHESGHFYPG